MKIAHYLSESWRLARKTAQGVLYRLGFVLSTRSLVFLKLDVAALPPGDVSEPAMHSISVADVRAQPLFSDGFYSREKTLDRLAQGHELFAIKHDGANACFGWMEQSRIEIKWTRLHFDMPRDVVYLGGLYTVPEMRGCGLASRMWLTLGQRCKNQGARHLLVTIDPLNTPSRQLHRKLGFSEYQIVHFKRFAFFNYYRVQDTQSRVCRRWVTLFGCPPELWKTFWPGAELNPGSK